MIYTSLFSAFNSFNKNKERYKRGYHIAILELPAYMLRIVLG